MVGNDATRICCLVKEGTRCRYRAILEGFIGGVKTGPGLVEGWQDIRSIGEVHCVTANVKSDTLQSAKGLTCTRTVLLVRRSGRLDPMVGSSIVRSCLAILPMESMLAMAPTIRLRVTDACGRSCAGSDPNKRGDRAPDSVAKRSEQFELNVT